MKLNANIVLFLFIATIQLKLLISQRIFNNTNTRTVFKEDSSKVGIVSPEISQSIRNSVINELINRKQSQTQLNIPNFKTSNGINVGLQSSPSAQLINEASSLALNISQIVSKNLNKNTLANPSIILSNLKAPEQFCPFKQILECNADSKYRSIDGSCNNLKNTWWGKSDTPYKRYLRPTYDDGITEARNKAKSGNKLPNPRQISNSLFNDNSKTEEFYTHILPIFGQFVAHDIVSTAVTTDQSGQILNCPCNSKNISCLSFDIPGDEKIMRFSECMSFTRSSAAFPTFDCTLGTREQLNILSAFIDGSQIYGMTVNRSLELRLFEHGKLLTTNNVGHRPMLPQAMDGQCKDTTNRIKCFGAGEGRTNENLGLLSLQTLFMREHNRIAGLLHTLNQNWNDEVLYQESRKIVNSVIQHITYNEFIPAIIGWNAASLFDLIPSSSGVYFNGYDPNIDPTIANEFATAAFRFGHTLIKNHFSRTNEKGKKIGLLPLSEIIFRPVEVYNENAGGLESILTGLVNDPSGKFDTSFADTLQNHLFEIKAPDGAFAAVDLAATNINRGRDHGLPSYNDYRRKCGLKVAKTFSHLNDTIQLDTINILSRVYENVDDIDLYVGGLSERPLVGAVVGPVFSCIIGNQFSDLKKGDRFYYENGNGPNSFSLEQLDEIKKITLARIICDNTDILEIQPNVFLQPLAKLNNAKVSCDKVRKINFIPWKQ